MGSDPVEVGLVTGLNRPGTNITGVTFFTAVLAAKRVGLLRELVPGANTIVVLMDADNPASVKDGANARAAAEAIGQQVRTIHVATGSDIDTAFEKLARERPDVLYVGPDPLFFNERERLAALARRHAVPAIYGDREIAVAGGMMSYGAGRTDAYRQAGSYVGRILKGEKPGDLPVVLPTKFELVINLKTAQALGLDVPPTLLARADEVIE
jgi:putative tryptophan/tyrosine transport system substrate-binding protein